MKPSWNFTLKVSRSSIFHNFNHGKGEVVQQASVEVCTKKLQLVIVAKEARQWIQVIQAKGGSNKEPGRCDVSVTTEEGGNVEGTPSAKALQPQ
jgi:hypothetical protein